MKKENKTKSEEKAKAAEPIAEVEKEEKEIQVNQDKVGFLMHEARLKKGLKIADASKDLCIRSTYLEAIEDGNYDEIPEPPYGIGFIRSYADYLGLNASRMVQLFKEETDAAAKNSDYYVMEPQTEANAPNKKSLMISLLAIILVYIGWYIYNQNQAKTENIAQSQEYSAEMSEPAENYPLQVEDFVSVEESGVELPVEEKNEEAKEQIPVVDVAPVEDGESGNVTVSEESFVPEENKTEEAVEEKKEPEVKAEEPKAEKQEVKEEVKKETKTVTSSKKPGSRVMVKIKGGENWLEVKDANKLYISKVLKDGDVYEVPAGEGMILSVGRYEGAEVYVDGKLTEVVKPNKKTGIALDPFLDSANH